MRFESSVQRLLLLILFGFGTVMAASVYWAVAGPETALNHPTNYRLRDAAASVVRGQILDRNNTLLVESVVNENGFVTRRTSNPSLFSLTGYLSRQYGVSGAEAVYNAILGGTTTNDNLNDAIRYDLLHIPRRGSDIRLTIDLETQTVAANALENLGAPGGAVVMDANTGELLAIVSAPTVDPATLDTLWPELIIDTANPFVNRATQGKYMPGSALSTVILTAWLIDGRSLNDILTITPDGETSVCNPANGELAVRAAFNYACADALNEMVLRLGKEKFDAAVALFGLSEPVVLDNFTLPEPTRSPFLRPEATLAPDAPLIERIGLDRMRLAPLDMAVTVAAIANGGNAPLPRLLTATRAPEPVTWVNVPAARQSNAVTTAQTAATVANAMRESSAEGLAFSETCAGTDIGATLGMSVNNETSTVFFTGFARLADGHTVVAVLAVENVDFARASDVAAAGNTMLCAALAGYAEG